MLLCFRPVALVHLTSQLGARAQTSCISTYTITDSGPLFGTVPSHRSYIFLHTHDPPATFPARISTPVWRALQLKASKWGGIVNFSWLSHRPGFRNDHPNCHSATAFSDLGGRLDIPEISLENLDEMERMLRKHAEGPLTEEATYDPEIHLYVCTHGARDCRCGNLGGAVVRALRNEVKERGKQGPNGLLNRVKIGEVGHVGGHQYAANLLIYPHGEWLGLLKPDDVPAVLTDILRNSIEPFDKYSPPLCPSHWRGRMGLSKEEQVDLFGTYYPSALNSII